MLRCSCIGATPMKFNTLLRCQLVALLAVKIEAAAVWSFSEYPQDLIRFNKTDFQGLKNQKTGTMLLLT